LKWRTWLRSVTISNCHVSNRYIRRECGVFWDIDVDRFDDRRNVRSCEDSDGLANRTCKWKIIREGEQPTASDTEDADDGHEDARLTAGTDETWYRAAQASECWTC
jgi:hypothetical protein